jgi:hypothetical protein
MALVPATDENTLILLDCATILASSRYAEYLAIVHNTPYRAILANAVSTARSAGHTAAADTLSFAGVPPSS